MKSIKLLSIFTLLLSPSLALAHSGHQTEGILTQAFNIEHIIQNMIAFAAILAIIFVVVQKAKSIKIKNQ